ncbi:MAG TPA: nitroreductase/quinone reductase family protein, partial [Anaerolineae bacterium]
MRILIKLFMLANAWLFRSTGGRLGGQLGRQSVLLLHTVGRKSGKAFVTPLTFYRDGERYLLVATNWGREEYPDWFLNLMRQARTRIQVKDETIKVQARQAEGEEYERMW